MGTTTFPSSELLSLASTHLGFMCHRYRVHHRCGHSTFTPIRRCAKATRDPITRRWRSCGVISHTITNQAGSLCAKDDCILSQKGGVWICCRCTFGYKDGNRNRHYECANTGCEHEICDHCLQWTRENVQAMIAAENTAATSSEPSSPSEQEFWDSGKSDADALEVE